MVYSGVVCSAIACSSSCVCFRKLNGDQKLRDRQQLVEGEGGREEAVTVEGMTGGVERGGGEGRGVE